MELRPLKEIAIITVNFTDAISMGVDIYLKICMAKRNNHPDAGQGGKFP